MKILVTGGSGFIGRNIIPILSKEHEILSPERKNLNLLDSFQVKKYIKEKDFDIILNLAQPNPYKNNLDRDDSVIEDSMKVFFNVYNERENCSKIIHAGSGAEYDKSIPIIKVREEESKYRKPSDYYGIIKHKMNDYVEKSENIINFRIFGCYGPTDDGSKFITHCIRCCIKKEPITIRQDCWFDYLHVFDLARAFNWAIKNKTNYKIYNVCSGQRISLFEIAEKVKLKMNSKSDIIIMKKGYNNEYTGNNSRFLNESGLIPQIDIDEGIELQIKWEISNHIRGNQY